MDYTKEYIKAVVYKGLNLVSLYVAAFAFTFARIANCISLGVNNE